jgi:cbb3-type cytochrome oxidase subunit 3
MREENVKGKINWSGWITIAFWLVLLAIVLYAWSQGRLG